MKNTKEAAKFLGLSPQSLRQYRYTKIQNIPYSKDEKGRVLYNQKDLDNHIGKKHFENLKVNEKYRDLKYLAKRFNISYGKMRYFIRAKEIPYEKIKNRIFLNSKSVRLIEIWLKEE